MLCYEVASFSYCMNWDRWTCLCFPNKHEGGWGDCRGWFTLDSNNIYQVYSSTIRLLDRWPLQVEDGRILREQIMRWGGGGGWSSNGSSPCRPDIMGVGLGVSWRAEQWKRNNTKDLLSFPTGVEVSQESTAIQTQALDKRIPFLCGLTVERSRELRGREKVGGGAVSRWRI